MTTETFMAKTARRYCQGLITMQHALYLTARHLDTDAMGALIALSDAVRERLGQ